MEKLLHLREQIEEIDSQILELIGKRLEVVRKVGAAKKKLNKPIRDRRRERELVDLLTNKAKKLKIPEEVVKRVWRSFFRAAYKLER